MFGKHALSLIAEVCACFICTCSYSHVHMLAHAVRGQRSTQSDFHSHSPPWFLRQNSHEFSLVQLAWLSSKCWEHASAAQVLDGKAPASYCPASSSLFSLRGTLLLLACTLHAMMHQGTEPAMQGSHSEARIRQTDRSQRVTGSQRKVGGTKVLENFEEDDTQTYKINMKI